MPAPRPLGELVTLSSESGLDLEGIVYRHESARTTILHVHGSFGNFYQGRLVKTMAAVYSEAGLNFLSVNMASHDGLAEGYWHGGDFRYVGGAVTRFEECSRDIAGAVAFAKTFSDRVILQGHSLGCDRILQFSIDRSVDHDLVLLAPCDSYQLQANWIAPETVESQIARLKNEEAASGGLDWLSEREYGIKGDSEWTYAIPATRQAFLSIAEGPPYRLMRVTSPASFSLTQRALAFIGGSDALQVWPAAVMFGYLRERVSSVEEAFLPSADHMFTGSEEQVAGRIVSWVFNNVHA